MCTLHSCHQWCKSSRDLANRLKCNLLTSLMPASLDQWFMSWIVRNMASFSSWCENTSKLSGSFKWLKYNAKAYSESVCPWGSKNKGSGKASSNLRLILGNCEIWPLCILTCKLSGLIDTHHIRRPYLHGWQLVSLKAPAVDALTCPLTLSDAILRHTIREDFWSFRTIVEGWYYSTPANCQKKSFNIRLTGVTLVKMQGAWPSSGSSIESYHPTPKPSPLRQSMLGSKLLKVS